MTRAALLTETMLAGHGGLAVTEMDRKHGDEWLEPMRALYQLGLVSARDNGGANECVYCTATLGKFYIPKGQCGD